VIASTSPSRKSIGASVKVALTPRRSKFSSSATKEPSRTCIAGCSRESRIENRESRLALYSARHSNTYRTFRRSRAVRERCKRRFDYVRLERNAAHNCAYFGITGETLLRDSRLQPKTILIDRSRLANARCA